MYYKTTVMTSLVDLVFVEVIISTRQRLFGENDKNDAPFVTKTPERKVVTSLSYMTQ